MGYADALEDKIKIRKCGKYIEYYPLCCECGEPVKVNNYRKGFRYTCERCKMKHELLAEIKNETISKESKKKRFEMAVRRIEKNSHVNISEYVKAIDLSRKALEEKNWFDSTEEMMTCIELVKNGFKVFHQVKIGTYRVDFLLPDQKIVLEIDGVQYHNGDTQQRERTRDELIRDYLGKNFEVIRFTDEDINTDITKLQEALFSCYKQRKRMRDTYGDIREGYRDSSLYF